MSNVISSLEARELVKKGAKLIDVRTEVEYSQGCLPGAENLPVAALEQLSSVLDQSKALIVYCRTGGRSAKAKSILDRQGFSCVHNIGSMVNF
ncbi:MAG: rhodanese-like domain-containing protein [Gammaproteobacteria bacterium]|nr:rhodanese-like domain-containing protein [Gammaproteobacteria bacterium]